MEIIKLAVVLYKEISENQSHQLNLWSKKINSSNPQTHQTNTPHHADQETLLDGIVQKK